MIVDSSDNGETGDVIESLRGSLSYDCAYHHVAVASAARQRNIGAELCGSSIILFLDDDVVLEPDFIAEILHVFQSQTDDRLGAVSGTITNQVYSDPKGLNRFLLGLCLGRFGGSFAGQVVGPAVNFLPADGPEAIQQVEWAPSGCVAYRREVFLAYRFEESFQGYSFAEDLLLSTRVAQKYRLINTTRARLYHADLGKKTHRNWEALGESQVLNRHLIMTTVLKRSLPIDYFRFFAFEMIYLPLALIGGRAESGGWFELLELLRGKLHGFWRLLTEDDPHRNGSRQA